MAGIKSLDYSSFSNEKPNKITSAQRVQGFRDGAARKKGKFVHPLIAAARREAALETAKNKEAFAKIKQDLT